MVLLMIIVSMAEVVSIGTVLPFLGLITSPDKVFVHDLTQPLIKLLRAQSPQDLLLPFTLIFSLAAILAGCARIILLLFQLRLSMAIGADLSIKVYSHTLYQPYLSHVSRNSSEILAGTQKAENLVYYVVQPVLLLISSVVILIAVTATLTVIHPGIAITSFVGFGLIYAVLALITRRRIARNSQSIAAQHNKVTKAVQEGLGGIRDVLINGTQSFYSKLYQDAFMPMQAAIASNHLVGASPRFVVEALGFVFIASFAYLITLADGASNTAVPLLGVLALGAQRLLPVLQQIYNSFILIKGNQSSTQDALNLLNQPVPKHAYQLPAGKTTIGFRNAIVLKDLGFRYFSQGSWALRKVNLHIPKGFRIGFFGITGSGKSTLLDIIMGLLTPTEGSLIVDNIEVTLENTRGWQMQISHVPQSIYLADASIAENIAFGVPTDLIDLNRVKQAAKQAQIAQTIEGWLNGYETLVGERGVRLSGGQRQRIGIARALYKRSTVIIFDEATSALDNETEAAVMQAVETLGRDITILIIAHRLTTLKNCDKVVELSSGGIRAIGDYAEMVKLK